MRIKKDGNKLLVTSDDFVDLQESDEYFFLEQNSKFGELKSDESSNMIKWICGSLNWSDICENTGFRDDFMTILSIGYECKEQVIAAKSPHQEFLRIALFNILVDPKGDAVDDQGVRFIRSDAVFYSESEKEDGDE